MISKSNFKMNKFNKNNKYELKNIFQLALKSFTHDWRNNILTFITFLVTATILNMFMLLSITAFRENSLGEKSKIENPEGPMMMFMIIGGIVIIMSVITLSIIIGQTIKKRNNYYRSFRIIGIRQNQLKLAIWIECLIMLLIAIVIGFIISVPVTSYTTTFLKKYYVLEPSWKTNYTWWYFILTFLALIFTSWIVVSKCMKKYKEINYSQSTFSLRKLKIRKIVGITLGVISIGMFFIKFLMYGDMGSGMIINAILALAGSIMLIGPNIFKYALGKLAFIFKKNSTLFISFKSLGYASGLLISPLCMIVSGTLTIVASTQLNGILSEAKIKYAGPAYSNVKSGLQLSKLERLDFAGNEIEDLYNNTINTTFISNQVFADIKPDGNLIFNNDQNKNSFYVKAIKSNNKNIFYNIDTHKGNLDDLYLSKTNIIVSSDTNARVGDSIEIKLNELFHSFNVVGVYKKPFIGDVLPHIFINANYIIDNNIHNYKVSRIVSTNDELLKYYNVYTKYEPIEELIYSSSIGKNISLLFAIVLGTYIIISSLSTLVSYVINKKKQYKLQRIILNTNSEIWKQLLIEMILFAVLSTTLICLFSLIFTAMFSWANGMTGLLFTMPLLYLFTILVQVVITISSYLIPMFVMSKQIKIIKR